KRARSLNIFTEKKLLYLQHFYEEPLFRIWHIYLNHLSWQKLTDSIIEQLATPDTINKLYDTKSENGNIVYYANVMFGCSLEAVAKAAMAPIQLMLLPLSSWIYQDLTKGLPNLFWQSLAYKKYDNRMAYLLKDYSALISLIYVASTESNNIEPDFDTTQRSYPAIELPNNNLDKYLNHHDTQTPITPPDKEINSNDLDILLGFKKPTNEDSYAENIIENIDEELTWKVKNVEIDISDKEAAIRNLKDIINLEIRDLKVLNENLEEYSNENLIENEIQKIKISFYTEKTFKNGNAQDIQKREGRAVKNLLDRIKKDKKRIIDNTKQKKLSLKEDMIELNSLYDSLIKLQGMRKGLLEFLYGSYSQDIDKDPNLLSDSPFKFS
ncbi:MAG: hypothetical protein WCH10_06510, partial [bacterium]